MNEQVKPVERVIGFDSHPDSFTAAAVRGPTPAAAIIEKMFNKVPMKQLVAWAQKNTTAEDLFVLEASGNTFHVIRTLQGIGRRAIAAESCHLGKLKEAHANNDKLSAVRIAKAYLAGTVKEVWVPDPKTQARRDWAHAHRKAVKRLVQARNSLLSYLSDNGVRLKGMGVRLATAPEAEVQEKLRELGPWSVAQWQLLELLLMQVRQAHEQRQKWRSLIAQAVLQDPELLSMVRLCGVREVVAFSLSAFIGDIHRFASPKKLVKYVGLNPAFDDSGESRWNGGVGGHGNKWMRCLLVQAAQCLLRCSTNGLATWGKKLLGRKGQKNLVVAAMARKLTVAVWYLMMGKWTAIEELDQPLKLKVTKIIGQSGVTDRKAKTQLREQAYQWLKEKDAHRLREKIYVMHPAEA